MHMLLMEEQCPQQSGIRARGRVQRQAQLGPRRHAEAAGRLHAGAGGESRRDGSRVGSRVHPEAQQVALLVLGLHSQIGRSSPQAAVVRPRSNCYSPDA